MSTLEIRQLPRQEQSKLMEMLWAELSREEADLESPTWHADALRETAERRARGETPRWTGSWPRINCVQSDENPAALICLQ